MFKTINEDEVGFITLHIHSAISSNQVAESMEATRVIHEGIVKLQKDLNIIIDVQSISYVRLMNHIKFLILRVNSNPPPRPPRTHRPSAACPGISRASAAAHPPARRPPRPPGRSSCTTRNSG